MQNNKIRFRDASEVVEFVDQVSKYDFEVRLQDKRRVIDAKSILGVLSMDLSHELMVRYYGDDPSFDKILKKYSIS